MEILENIKIKLAEIAKKKEELTEELRKDFAPMLLPFFKKSNGSIKSISWQQYTPYFNDGEECTFSVNLDLDYAFKVNGESLDESDFFTVSTYGLHRLSCNDGSYEDWIGKYPEDKIDQVKNADQIILYNILLEIVSLIESIPDEFLKELFGDHVEVTVKNDGTIETEEYEHD